MAVEERLLRVSEVARRLNLEGPLVYELILRGELDAGKGRNGAVYVPERAVEEFARKHASTP